MSAKKSKTFFKTLTAILVLLLFFGGYYIYSSGIFGASVTENISEHSITDLICLNTYIRVYIPPLFFISVKETCILVKLFSVSLPIVL